MKTVNDNSRNISIQKAAELLGKGQQFVRLCLQQKEFPFGMAIKRGSKWNYYINPKQFYDFLGMPLPEECQRQEQQSKLERICV